MVLTDVDVLGRRSTGTIGIKGDDGVDVVAGRRPIVRSGHRSAGRRLRKGLYESEPIAHFDALDITKRRPVNLQLRRIESERREEFAGRIRLAL